MIRCIPEEFNLLYLSEHFLVSFALSSRNRRVPVLQRVRQLALYLPLGVFRVLIFTFCGFFSSPLCQAASSVPCVKFSIYRCSLFLNYGSSLDLLHFSVSKNVTFNRLLLSTSSVFLLQCQVSRDQLVRSDLFEDVLLAEFKFIGLSGTYSNSSDRSTLLLFLSHVEL